MKIKANNANSPIWKDVYSHSKLPQQLEPLNEIATNLWWVWNHEGAKLFGKIDKQLWKSTEGNPVLVSVTQSGRRAGRLFLWVSVIGKSPFRQAAVSAVPFFPVRRLSSNSPR